MGFLGLKKYRIITEGQYFYPQVREFLFDWVTIRYFSHCDEFLTSAYSYESWTDSSGRYDTLKYAIEILINFIKAREKHNKKNIRVIANFKNLEEIEKFYETRT